MTEILELQLEQFNVPDACKRTVVAVLNHVKPLLRGDLSEDLMKEVLEYAEQLEARVQDEVDKTRPLEQVEQIEDAFETPDSDDVITFKNADGDIYRAVINGVVFGTLCNEFVWSELDRDTFCIKQWGHSHPEHEDSEGRTR
jgi:hypothetical protein